MFQEIRRTQLKAAAHTRAHSRAKNATALARIAIAGGQASHPRLPLALCSAWSRTICQRLWRVYTASVKGFTIGAGLKGGLALFSVDEIISALGGHCRTATWRALLAGAIAGPSLLLTGFDNQHTSLAIFILMQAAVLASRCGIKKSFNLNQ